MQNVFDIKLNQSLIRPLALAGVLLLMAACSGQPAEDIEDVLDTPIPTPSPTATPTPISGTSVGKTWDSSGDFSEFSLTQAQVLGSGSIQESVAVIGESGRIDITDTIDNGSFVTVNFRNTYVDPVIICFVATNNEGEPVEVRARNVGSTSAELFLEEDSGGAHATETVVYFVVEKGRHEFSDGTIIEAGSHVTASYHNGVSGSYGGDAISFSVAFPASPAVFSSLNSYNNGDFMSSIAYQANTSGFTLQQEAAETGNVAVSESVAWMAVSKGSSSLPLATFEVDASLDGSNDGPDNGTPHIISFSSFSANPDVIVKQSSGNGNNGGWARGEGTWNTTAFNVYSEEDQVNDAERSHIDEEFSSFALSPNSDVGGYFSSAEALSPEMDLSGVIEVQSTSVSWTESIMAGTSLVVESRISLDGGSNWSSWLTVTQGGSINGLSLGTDVSNGLLQLRVSFSTSDDGVTARLDSLNLSVMTNIP